MSHAAMGGGGGGGSWTRCSRKSISTFRSAQPHIHAHPYSSPQSGSLRKEGTPDPQIEGSPENKDPNKVPKIS